MWRLIAATLTLVRYIETIPNGIAGNKKIMQVKITQWYKEYNDFYAKENERDIILKSTIPHIF